MSDDNDECLKWGYQGENGDIKIVKIIGKNKGKTKNKNHDFF